MLIVPMHRALTLATLPLMTLLLILVNGFVFFVMQSSDDRALQRANDYYTQAQLGRIEFPAYRLWLKEQPERSRRFDGVEIERLPPQLMLQLIESDDAFLDALHADRIIAPDHPGYADWHEQRVAFERIRDSAFTPSHYLRYSQIEPGRIFSSMFMHGGFSHLLGNMIFLAVLGLLVEGALGPWWFLGLYLLGGVGAAFTSLAWHWGDHGALLGASGAIAALMGAYCVLWGIRKVRVFYWFFVIFDYVRVPALLLLPIWFGWQVLSLWLERGANVAFDAHAGGILSGALLAYGLRRAGKVRDDFVEQEQRDERHKENVAAFDQALQHLGRLEIIKARDLLERIDREEPGQLKVLMTRYRCERYGGTPAQLDAAAAKVFGFVARNQGEIRDIKSTYEDYQKSCAGQPRVSGELLLRLILPWQRIGEETAAESLLRTIAVQTPGLRTLPAAWYALALRAPEGSAARRARLQHVLDHHAQSDFAPKAQFLLQQG